MCSVLLLREVLPDSPLAVFFVRDEEISRGGSTPERRADAPEILAPRDPEAGGTWFGVSDRGFVAGLVNRKGDPVPEAGLSRGRLLLDALSAGSAAEALERSSQAVQQRAYGGCRLFAGDRELLGWVDLPVSGHPSPVHEIAQGSWLLRHRHHPEPAPAILLPEVGETAVAWCDRVADLVADHHPENDPLCVHGEAHGSVDTSCVVLGPDGSPVLFRHLQGAPCSGDLVEYL